jgi:hypothetical protein
LARPPACPICAAPTDARYRPFCSRRCADVDLARWLQGTYAVPVASTDDDEDGEETQQSGAPGPARPSGREPTE